MALDKSEAQLKHAVRAGLTVKYDLMCQVPGPLVGCLPDAEVYFRGQMVGVCGEREDREAGSQAGSDRFKER